LLKQLKEHGFRIVQVVPAGPGRPETPIASATEMRVAWTSALQDIMDDSGDEPIWPAFNAALQPDRVALAVPAADAFDTIYPLVPAAALNKIEIAAASGDEDPVPAHTASWPDQQEEAALQDADPQLPAPSVQDIGWPVQDEYPAAGSSAEPSGETGASAPGRHRHAHMNRHNDTKLNTHNDARLNTHHDAKLNTHQLATHRDAKLDTHNDAKPNTRNVTHPHARAPAGGAEKHAGIAATISAPFMPTY
jgi:hypothetical protein